MSKIFYDYEVEEVLLEKGSVYKRNLPHHDLIADIVCKKWNDMHMEQYFDGELKGKIKSATMHCHKSRKRETILTVTIEGIYQYRFTENRRKEAWAQIDAQFSDGWGEGIFGAGNPMTGADGIEFYIE